MPFVSSIFCVVSLESILNSVLSTKVNWNWISTTWEMISTHCGTYSLSLWAVALLAIALQAEKKELSSSCFSALLSVKGSLIKFCAAAEKCYCFPRNMDCLLRLVIVKLSYFRYGNVFLVIWYQFLNLESTPEVVFYIVKRWCVTENFKTFKL